MNIKKKKLKKSSEKFVKKFPNKISTFKELRKKKIFATSYFYKNKKLEKGVFLRKPTFKKIFYPFYLNLKLVNEYLKKK
jgi:hypothetical protein